jgi:myosin-crossreactive antigen
VPVGSVPVHPSIEIEGASVLDEFYWLNKDDPNYSLQRATVNRGQDAHTDGLFTLSEKAQKEIVRIFLATREEMEGKRINDVFGDEFFASNFWLYWRTMFAFEEWHSALEMKLYLHRFIHHIGGLPDFSALKFTNCWTSSAVYPRSSAPPTTSASSSPPLADSATAKNSICPVPRNCAAS